MTADPVMSEVSYTQPSEHLVVLSTRKSDFVHPVPIWLKFKIILAIFALYTVLHGLPEGRAFLKFIFSCGWNCKLNKIIIEYGIVFIVTSINHTPEMKHPIIE